MRKSGPYAAAGVLMMALLGVGASAQPVQWQEDGHFLIATARVTQTATHDRAASLADVKVTTHRGQTKITIKLSPAVMPVVSELSDPDRLVLDFPATTPGLGRNRIRVNRDGVSAIRIGIQPGEPPTTRLVVDLASMREHQLTLGRSEVVLTLGREEHSQPPESAAASAESGSERGTQTKGPEPAQATAGANSAAHPESKKEDSTGSQAVVHNPATTAGVIASGLAGNDPPGLVNSVPESASMRGDNPSEAQRATQEPPHTNSGASPPPGLKGAPAVSAAELAAVQNASPHAFADSSILTATNVPAPGMGLAEEADSTSKQEEERSSAAGPKPTNATTETADPIKSQTMAASDPAGTTVSAASFSAPPLSSDTRGSSGVNSSIRKNAPTLAQPQSGAIPADYVIGEQDQLNIIVWKEPELSGTVVVRPDGKITVPLINEIRVVGMTPSQLQSLLTEKLKPFINVPQVTVVVRQISSRKVFLIGEVAREGGFPINSSTTVLQIIAESGGLKDFAKRKDIYVLRDEKGRQVRYRFNYDQVIRGKDSQENIILQPGDTIVVP